MYLGTEIDPVSSMAFNPVDDTLWVLEGDGSHALWRVDPDTGEPVFFNDAGGIPEFADLHTISAFMVDSEHPSGGGFLLLLGEWRDWQALPHQEVGEDLQCYVLYDTNLDGVVDQQFASSWAEFQALQFLDNAVPFHEVDDD